jgi:hypothetical protein
VLWALATGGFCLADPPCSAAIAQPHFVARANRWLILPRVYDLDVTDALLASKNLISSWNKSNFNGAITKPLGHNDVFAGNSKKGRVLLGRKKSRSRRNAYLSIAPHSLPKITIDLLPSGDGIER